MIQNWHEHIQNLVLKLRIMSLILGLCETEKETLEEAARILEKNENNLINEQEEE